MTSAVARRRNGYTHDVEIDGGHTVVFDEPVDKGGDNAAPSPTDMLAASLAACTAITMEMYADRKEWPLDDVEVSVEMEKGSDEDPRSFEVTIRLPKELSEEQIDRLRVIAGKCPVHRALKDESDVSIIERVELI
jgi:putative redox protein